MVLEFSKASFKTSALGVQYWEYKVLGDAELLFDETNSVFNIYNKFISPTIYTDVTACGCNGD